MINEDKLRGMANQDQLYAEIANTWGKTDDDMQDELLSWIEDDDVARAAEFVHAAPPEWIAFIQRCCLAGLRESVIQSE